VNSQAVRAIKMYAQLGFVPTPLSPQLGYTEEELAGWRALRWLGIRMKIDLDRQPPIASVHDARGPPSCVAADQRASLSEQPGDVIALVGAALLDVLRPRHHAALAATCRSIHQTLAPAAAALANHARRLNEILFDGKTPARRSPWSGTHSSGEDIIVLYLAKRGIRASDCELICQRLVRGHELTKLKVGGVGHSSPHPS
jgi:hypothetical protein